MIDYMQNCEKMFWLTRENRRFHETLMLPIPSEKESQETTQRRHQNFDYKTIADLLRLVGLGKYMYCHPTGVVKANFAYLRPM